MTGAPFVTGAAHSDGSRPRTVRALISSVFGRARRLLRPTRHCPICSYTGPFLPFGVDRRPNAHCPSCGSLERHRLLWLFLRERTDLLGAGSKRMLHVAPEPCFEPRLRALLGTSYVTADLSNPAVDVRMDVTAIDFPDGSFDVIYCSHVLEHVPDDRKALREFRRVLKPTGWAIILVPVVAPVTDEDPSITDPAERLRRFGQEDHFRLYGPDYVDRLREAGFRVTVKRPHDLCEPSDAARIGLTHAAGEIYYCEPI